MKKLTNEIILINSLSDFSKTFSEFNRKQSFRFVCEKCGCEQISIKKTILKLKSLKCSDCRRKESMLEKYGVENPFQDKEKIKAACIAKLGVENPQKLKEVREKTKKTNLKKFGCETPLQLEKSKEASSMCFCFFS